MTKPRSSAALVIAVVLLLLPMIYVGSYLALVDPILDNMAKIEALVDGSVRTEDYRYGGRAAAIVYWPLEQLDRQLRPAAWVQKKQIYIEYIEGLDMMITHGPPPKSDAQKHFEKLDVKTKQGPTPKPTSNPNSQNGVAVPDPVRQQMEMFNALQEGKLPRKTVNPK